MWHAENLIRDLLKPNYPLNITKESTNLLKHYNPIFSANTFISYRYMRHNPEIGYKVAHPRLLSIDEGFTFRRGDHLSSKDFEVLLDRYSTHLYSNFKHNLNLFEVKRNNADLFTLNFNTHYLEKGNYVNNYIDYLSILSVNPVIKPNVSSFNYTSSTYRPRYKILIQNTNIQTVDLVSGVPVRNAIFFNMPAKFYMFIYKKNSEYFLRVGCITCLDPSNYHLYEKYFQSLYHGLWDLLGETRSPDIGVSNSQIDTHSVINISQADYYDWDVLTTLPEHITHLEQPPTQVLWGGI